MVDSFSVTENERTDTQVDFQGNLSGRAIYLFS